MYTIENEQEAVKSGVFIYKEVYKKQITKELFAHKHLENPSRLEFPYVFNCNEDKPVVMRWLMGTDFVCGETKIKAAQSSDDAALPEARGLAFVKVAKSSEKLMKDQGVQFVYGCYYPGNAMNIAQKLGEKNVINLPMAKLVLTEGHRRWKRFNLPVPSFISKISSKKHIKKLQAFANEANCEISSYDSCPFTDDDYTKINSGNALHITRSAKYYDWKLSMQVPGSISYITARKDGKLLGFAIVKSSEKDNSFVDWDVFTDDRKQKLGILAAIVLKSIHKNAVAVPSLNDSNGEMQLFLELGFNDWRKMLAPVCICAKSYDESINDIIYEAKNWKHRLIDTDYFLN